MDHFRILIDRADAPELRQKKVFRQIEKSGRNIRFRIEWTWSKFDDFRIPIRRADAPELRQKKVFQQIEKSGRNIRFRIEWTWSKFDDFRIPIRRVDAPEFIVAKKCSDKLMYLDVKFDSGSIEHGQKWTIFRTGRPMRMRRNRNLNATEITWRNGTPSTI